MKLNTVPILDLSTAHLSDATFTWVDNMVSRERDPDLRNLGQTPPISIMEREEGFFISTAHADAVHENPDIPADLMHILRFAHANDQQYVLFDCDGPVQDGLPVYEEGDPQNRIDREHPFIGMNKTSWHDVRDPGAPSGEAHLGKIEAVSGMPENDLRLNADPAHGRVLEDADYEAPDGVWIGIGEASVRVNMNDDFLWMEMFARGQEMGESFGRVDVLRADLALAIHAADLDASMDDAAEP